MARSGILARRPIYRIGQSPIRRVSELKYLGVKIDQTLSWLPHIRSIRARMNLAAARLSRLAKLDFGLRGSAIHAIYKRALERWACYGCGAWWNDISHAKMDELLLRVQRPVALRITRANRTVATQAVLVLAGLEPLPLVVGQEAAFFRMSAVKESTSHCSKRFPAIALEDKEEDVWRLHPSLRVGLESEPGYPTMSGMEVFTDRSKDGTYLGSAYCVYSVGVLVHSAGDRLNAEASVFQAELLALSRATQWLLDRPGSEPITVYSDSQSSLQALSDGYHRGRMVLEIRGRVLASGIAELSLSVGSVATRASTGTSVRIPWPSHRPGVQS